jgi:hypothetical protein
MWLFSSVFAISSMVFIGQQVEAKSLKKIILEKIQPAHDHQLNESCTDFTGSWTGSCADDSAGKFSDETLTITMSECKEIWLKDGDNYEESISINGASRLGGTRIDSASNWDYNEFAEWNVDKSVLIRHLSGTGSESAGTYARLNGTQKMYIEDEKLIIMQETVGQNYRGGLPTAYFRRETCTYTRQTKK